MATALQRYRFTVEDLAQMVQAGIIPPEKRVELLAGEIVEMTPISPRHAACVDRVANRLFGLVRDRAILRIQSPVTLPPASQPQPDLALLRPREDFYASSHPGPADVLLLVEVAESSRSYDLGVKVPLYAQAGIPEVWVLDLETERLLVFREPSPQGYKLQRLCTGEDRLAPLAFPDLEVTAGELFPGGTGSSR